MTRFQFVTSYTKENRHRLKEILTEVIAGGCTCVQFSWGHCSDLELYKYAEYVRRITEEYGVDMVVNNRLDVAIAVSADALHIGQQDIPHTVARQLLPSSIKLGLTLDHYSQFDNQDVDYFGIGPIFKTTTKFQEENLFGVDGIIELRKLTEKPLVAIGGITYDNMRECLEAGATGVAVLGEIYRSIDVKQSVTNIRHRLI